ncbi:MAG: flagellar FliJ family protein [Clostridia bacterium]|nr:flagellar FliJ family protein [Clostridia bacterium]
MKRFKFSLQTLLNVALALEKEQKNALAVINNQLHELNEKKEAVIRRREDLNAFYAKAHSLDEFIYSNNYLMYLKEVLSSLDTEISVKEYEKEKVQTELAETMKKRKTYEKLREKQLEIYKKELESEESKYLNDFISCNGGETNRYG